jgi:nucleoside phosphorylase
MGNVYAAVTTTRIAESIRRKEIYAHSFVLLGISGANPTHSTAPRLGDVILGDQVFEHDYGQKLDPSIGGSDGTKRQGYSLPIHAASEVHAYIVEEDMKTWLKRSVPRATGERGRSRQHIGRVVVGAVASGDYVIKSAAKREELVKAYPQTVAIEMEAVGVAHALSQIPGIRFVFIKGVVDFCDGKKTDVWHAAAARNAAALFVYLLRAGAL